MWRPQTLNAATFLIDEDRHIGGAGNVTQIIGQAKNLVGRNAIACKQNKAERRRLAKERALLRTYAWSLKTIYRRVRGHENRFTARAVSGSGNEACTASRLQLFAFGDGRVLGGEWANPQAIPRAFGAKIGHLDILR